jgi:hypothetical protein
VATRGEKSTRFVEALDTLENDVSLEMRRARFAGLVTVNEIGDNGGQAFEEIFMVTGPVVHRETPMAGLVWHD